MSRINGDKSRFHRERKQKIAQRTRNRELVKGLTGQRKATPDLPGVKPKAT